MDGFKIGEGFVSVKAELDRTQINTSAALAGSSAGETVIKTVSHKVKKDSSLKSELGGAFTESLGSALRIGMTGGLSVLGSLNKTLGSNPYVAGFAVALGAAIAAIAAPAMGAALSGALMAGAGLGTIGLGAWILKDEPLIAKALTKLKERIKSTLKDAAKPLRDPLFNAIGTIRSLVREIGPDLKDMFASVAPAVKPLTEGFAGFVREMMPGLKELVASSGPFLTELAKALPGLGESIGQFFGLVSEGGPGASQFFKDFLWFLGNQIVLWGAVIGWLAKGYLAVRSFFTSIPGWIETAKTKFQEIWDKVSGFFSDLWTKATQLPDQIKNAITSLPSKFGEVLNTLFQRAAYLLGFGIGSVVKFFIDLPGKVWNAITSLPGKVASIFTSAKTSATNTTSGLVSSAVGILKTLPGKAWNAISGLPGKIKSVVSGANKWLYSAGKDIIKGLANGIQDMLGWAVEKAKQAASAIAQGFKDALGINSPSKLMADEVGRWIPPGIAEGINRSMPTAQQSINSAATTMAATTAPTAQPATTNSTVIQQLVVHLKGILDPSDPMSYRRLIAELQAALKNFERGYA